MGEMNHPTRPSWAEAMAQVIAQPHPLGTCPCCHQLLPDRASVAKLAFSAAMEVYGIDERTIRGPAQDLQATKARALVVWALQSLGKRVSYTAIGRMMNDRDRTTIYSSHMRAIHLRLTDPEFRLACEAIAIAHNVGELYARA